jgi:hypothetical protein
VEAMRNWTPDPANRPRLVQTDMIVSRQVAPGFMQTTIFSLSDYPEAEKEFDAFVRGMSQGRDDLDALVVDIRNEVTRLMG